MQLSPLWPLLMRLALPQAATAPFLQQSGVAGRLSMCLLTTRCLRIMLVPFLQAHTQLGAVCTFLHMLASLLGVKGVVPGQLASMA